jgi:hypothetical protein
MHASSEFAVINFLKNATGGIFNCPIEVAKGLLSIINQPLPYVIKSRYTALKNGYEVIRTIICPSDKIADVVAQKPVETPGFYRYEACNPGGEVVFTLHTLDGNLFD